MKNYTISIIFVLFLTSFAAFPQQPQRDKNRTPRLSSDDINRSPDSKITASPDRQLDHYDPIKVLFVGNSYTYVNNLPQVVEQMSLSANESRPLEAKMVAPGGAA